MRYLMRGYYCNKDLFSSSSHIPPLFLFALLLKNSQLTTYIAPVHLEPRLLIVVVAVSSGLRYIFSSWSYLDWRVMAPNMTTERIMLRTSSHPTIHPYGHMAVRSALRWIPQMSVNRLYAGNTALTDVVRVFHGYVHSFWSRRFGVAGWLTDWRSFGVACFKFSSSSSSPPLGKLVLFPAVSSLRRKRKNKANNLPLQLQNSFANISGNIERIALG